MSSRVRMASRSIEDASGLNLAIVLGHYHPELGEGLLRGALERIREHGLPPQSVSVFRVPGAFEVPQAASRIIARHDPRLDALVALGVLVRGETLHFDVLSYEVCRALGEVGRITGVPVAFGILTVNNEEQARDRTGAGPSNKGWEAAGAAIEMALLFRRLENSESFDRDRRVGGRKRPSGK